MPEVVTCVLCDVIASKLQNMHIVHSVPCCQRGAVTSVL